MSKPGRNILNLSNLLSIEQVDEKDMPKSREVLLKTTSLYGVEGEGFQVRRAFAGVDYSLLDPFLHMDQIGPVEYEPFEARGTSWHPHRGFETVTYMLEGELLHQDSSGGGGLITKGSAQWMTAGKGILHIETPTKQMVKHGGSFFGIQLWVNLPSEKKMAEPKYQALDVNSICYVTDPAQKSLIRLIAGKIDGFKGPGKPVTPLIVAHITVHADSTLEMYWPENFNALCYVLEGEGLIGGLAPVLAEAGQLCVLGKGRFLKIKAKAKPLDVLVLGGLPLKEPVAWWGPFVMNTKDQVEQAMYDYRNGKIGMVPANALQPFYRTAKQS